MALKEERALEDRFKDRMVEITREAETVNCPTQVDFIGQVREHGTRYAKRLLRQSSIPAVVYCLCHKARADLTLEYQVGEIPDFHDLFDDEDREAARWRPRQAKSGNKL